MYFITRKDINFEMGKLEEQPKFYLMQPYKHFKMQNTSLS